MTFSDKYSFLNVEWYRSTLRFLAPLGTVTILTLAS